MERFKDIRKGKVAIDRRGRITEKMFNSEDAPTGIDKVKEWLDNPRALAEFVKDEKEMERMYTYELSLISGRKYELNSLALIRYSCKKTIHDYENCPEEVKLYRVDWKSEQDWGAIPKGKIPKENLSCHWSDSLVGVMRYLYEEPLFAREEWQYLKEPVKISTCMTTKDNINWVAEVFYVLCGYEYERERRIIDNTKLYDIGYEDYTVEEFSKLYNDVLTGLRKEIGKDDLYAQSREFMQVYKGMSTEASEEAYWDYMVDMGRLVDNGDGTFDKVGKEGTDDNISKIFDYLETGKRYGKRDIRIRNWEGDIDSSFRNEEFLPERIGGNLVIKCLGYSTLNFENPVEVMGNCTIEVMIASKLEINHPENLHVHGYLRFKGDGMNFVIDDIDEIRKIKVDGKNPLVSHYDKYGEEDTRDFYMF